MPLSIIAEKPEVSSQFLLEDGRNAVRVCRLEMSHFRKDSVISVCRHTEESSTNTESTRDASCCSSPSSATVVSSVVFGNGCGLASSRTTTTAEEARCPCNSCLPACSTRRNKYKCAVSSANSGTLTKERCCFVYDTRERLLKSLENSTGVTDVEESERYCSHLERYKNSVRLARVVVSHILNAALLIVSMNACFSSTGHRDGQWFSITTFVNRSCMVIGTLLPFVGSLLHNVGRDVPARADTVHMQSVFVGYLVVVIAQSTAYRVQNHYDVEFHMSLLSNTTLLTLHGALLLTILARRYSLFKFNSERCRLLHRSSTTCKKSKKKTVATAVKRSFQSTALCGTCEAATCTTEEVSAGETATESARSSPYTKKDMDSLRSRDSVDCAAANALSSESGRSNIEETQEPVTPYETLEKLARASLEPYLSPQKPVTDTGSEKAVHNDYVPFDPTCRPMYTVENEIRPDGKTANAVPDCVKHDFMLGSSSNACDRGTINFGVEQFERKRYASRRANVKINGLGEARSGISFNSQLPTMQDVSRAVELLYGMLELTPLANNSYSSYMRNVTARDIYVCTRLARFVEAIYYRCRDTLGESEFDFPRSSCVGVPTGYTIELSPYLNVYDRWSACMKRLSAGGCGSSGGFVGTAIRKESTSARDMSSNLQGKNCDDCFRGG